MITTYRQKPLPAYLAYCGFIRERPALRGTIEEEWSPIRKCIVGDACITEFEEADFLTLAWSSFTPEEGDACIAHYSSHPLATFSFQVFKWRITDVITLLRVKTDDRFKETCKCKELDFAAIRSLAAPISIIPFLKYALQLTENQSLAPTKEEIEKIKATESCIFAELNLRNLKQQLAGVRKSAPTGRVALSPGLVNRILANHGSRCFFSGTPSTETRLHIHHIVPVRIIELLQLPGELFTAEYNLVPVCDELNLAKSATLAAKDVRLYLERFRDLSHPNHQIVCYLEKVAAMQPSGDN